MQTVKKPEPNHADVEEVRNTLVCAKWLVHQFENMNMHSVASLFQQALSDAEIWIENMTDQDGLEHKFVEEVKEQEAKAIHNILVKYASIDDKDIREGILSEMLRITKQSYN